MKKVTLLLIVIAILLIGWWLYSSIGNPDDFSKNLENHYKGVNCNILIGKKVRPNSDILQSEKDICISEQAWFENNSKLCRSHSDPDHCHGWMAIKTGDLSLCELKEKKEGYFPVADDLKESEKEDAWLYDCYRATANWRNEPTICDKIPYNDPSSLESCKKTSSGFNHYSKYTEFSPI